MIYKIIKQIPLVQFVIQEVKILFVLMFIYAFVYFCLYISLKIEEYKSKKEKENGNKKDEYT